MTDDWCQRYFRLLHPNFCTDAALKRQHTHKCEPPTCGMVSNGGSEVILDQSAPVFAVTEGSGTDALLFCMLSSP